MAGVTLTDTIDFDPDIFLDWSGDSSYIYTHTLSLALGESLTDAILFITFQDDGDCAGEEVSLILNGRSAWHSHPVYSDTYSGNVFRYLEDNSLVVFLTQDYGDVYLTQSVVEYKVEAPSVVPAPAGILLAGFGTGLVGLIRRSIGA
jgi:hypothetical protein